MKIALVAPFDETVPPPGYGGVELVVYNLAEQLVRKGHSVHLIASGDSKTRATLHPVFSESLRSILQVSGDASKKNAYKSIGIGRVVSVLRELDVDIVHNHIGWRLLPFSSLCRAPMITTLHGPLDVEYQQFVYGNFPDHHYVSISESQRIPMPQLKYIATVYNGIDPDKFAFAPNPGNYLAFLGRISPEKGPDIAIRVAQEFKMKLKIAAKVDPVDQKYFREKIEPLIDGSAVEFIGEIGPAQKSDFLKNAYALLAPIQWREPFGLFMIEAMACGTPVVVTDMGAAREVVADHRTGLVVGNSPHLFLQALDKIPRISRHECRARVERFFSVAVMTERYINTYASVLTATG